MYKLDRIVQPIENIVHTHNMYQVDRLYKSPQNQSDSVCDEETQLLVTRLNDLDASVSHLLNLFQSSVKAQSGKPKRTTVVATPQVTQAEPKETILAPNLPAMSLAVQANPENPPIAALMYCHALYTRGSNVSLHSYVHSTVAQMPDNLRKYLTELSIINTRQVPAHALRIVWIPNAPDCLTFVGINSTVFYGEVMLLQKLLTVVSPNDWGQHSDLLMQIDSLQMDDGPTDVLNKLAQAAYFSNLNREFPSLVDCYFYSIIKRKNLSKCLPANLSQWFKSCSTNQCFVTANVYWKK